MAGLSHARAPRALAGRAAPALAVLSPVPADERAQMRAFALDGAGSTEIMGLFGRSRSVVRRQCEGLNQTQVTRRTRMLAILDVVENSDLPHAVLAPQLGYRNAASLGVVLTRARKLRRRWGA
ncbi:hypothetical protein ACLBYG_21005 [Methylobacterium sp. D53M]